MGHDNVKGRVMLAAKDLEPGEIVLEDPPLVAASWHRHRCLECHDLHDSSSCEHVCKNYPAVVTRALARIEKFLEGLESIGELDSARRLIKLLNKCRNNAAVEKQTEPCTATNLDKCLASIRAIRAHATARHIIPEGMSDERAARLLGVLNANSHELEEWGGSGLYPRACLMEHSCAPNCTFNTSGTALWVTAIEPIAAGAALSIDYTDSVFEPASARREHLLSAYGFTCTCAACSSQPDLNRAFLCPACAATLCPRGLGLRPRDWQCVGCGRQVLRGERERFVRLEHALTEEPPESLDEVDEVTPSQVE